VYVRVLPYENSFLTPRPAGQHK